MTEMERTVGAIRRNAGSKDGSAVRADGRMEGRWKVDDEGTGGIQVMDISSMRILSESSASESVSFLST
jgi:hypothetical protein